MHKLKYSKLPLTTSDADLAERFTNFSMKKIVDIRIRIIDEQANSDIQVKYIPHCANTILSFQLRK